MLDIGTNCTVLFLGAHADDIEIGAGGTAAKLNDMGVNCVLVVASRESDTSTFIRRKAETFAAAQHLGFHSDNIGCLELPDSHLKCDGFSVKKLREWLSTRNFTPDLVITHVPHDRHNDHRTLYEIACSAVREATIIGMAVVNSLSREDFAPSIFVEIENLLERKIAALRAHASQIELARIRLDECGFSYLPRPR